MRSAPGRSALFTTNRSDASINPAFIVWIESPDSGTTSTTSAVRRGRNVQLRLPHAHRLDQDAVEPERIEHVRDLLRREGQAAQRAARGHPAALDRRDHPRQTRAPAGLEVL